MNTEPKKLRYKEDDINLLLPSFKPRVQGVLEDMRSLGYTPVLRDTVRTEAEAAANAAKGTGSVNSMHLYGCAADIICNDHGWACAAAKCKFYVKLGYAVEAHGMYWGGRFKKVDQPHMQGVPAIPRAQNAIRALGHEPESAAKRDAMVKAALRPVEAV